MASDLSQPLVLAAGYEYISLSLRAEAPWLPSPTPRQPSLTVLVVGLLGGWGWGLGWCRVGGG